MVALSSFITSLLPSATDLRFEDAAFHTPKQLTLVACAIQESSICPGCGQTATRVHSRYTRRLADLPLANVTVQLQLGVRKFFCSVAACSRRIFTERLPTVMTPWARRTVRLAHQQQHLGLALGGSASARLSTELDQSTSRNTFLRLVRRLPVPEPIAPEVIGIDDWAWLKGQRYGTIIVDLERHQPIALLEDRNVETLAAWLQQYPSIRVVARDRGGIYAEAITKGAPQAIQVADRFHILRNLADTLLSVFEEHTKQLRSASSTSNIASLDAVQPSRAETIEEVVRTLPPASPSVKHQAQAEQRRAARLALYERARELHAQGWSLRAIGRELGLNRNTVRSYIRAKSFPERQPRVVDQPGVLEPYIPYLIERWNAGCRTGSILWNEIKARGYTGKRTTVFSFVTRLRKALGIPTKNRTIRDGKVRREDNKPLTPRRAVWQVLQRPDRRDAATSESIVKLREAHADLAEAITLTEEFAALVRAGNLVAFDSWLEQAANSTLTPFQRFAASLRRDEAAVRAGIELPWSTGPVEGAINRLKMLKRTMFGRAGFALLQRRVLCGAP